MHTSDEEDEHSDDDMSDEVRICKCAYIVTTGSIGGGGLPQ